MNVFSYTPILLVSLSKRILMESAKISIGSVTAEMISQPTLHLRSLNVEQCFCACSVLTNKWGFSSYLINGHTLESPLVSISVFHMTRLAVSCNSCISFFFLYFVNSTTFVRCNKFPFNQTKDVLR